MWQELNSLVTTNLQQKFCAWESWYKYKDFHVAFIHVDFISKKACRGWLKSFFPPSGVVLQLGMDYLPELVLKFM